MKAAILEQFTPPPAHLEEGHDFGTRNRILKFSWENQAYEVEVAEKYDKDYDPRDFDLSNLGIILRKNCNSPLLITTKGWYVLVCGGNHCLVGK